MRRKAAAQADALQVEPLISLCMIVRNEARFLGRCLFHHKPLADEIVLVDTGSTDRTKDLASIYNARIYDYAWRDDFAAARNFSIGKATGRWILILDADELIAPEDFACLRKLTKESAGATKAYSIVTRNYCHKANTIGWQPNTGQYKKYESGMGWFPSRKVRLFKRDPAVSFDFPVHERVEPSMKNRGVKIADCPIPVHHYGHLDETLNQKKARAYYKLGYAKLDLFRNNPEALRELAVQAGQLERWEEAIDLWHRLLNLVPKHAEGYINLAGAYWQLGEYRSALSFSQKALDLAPGLKEARLNAAISHMMLGELGPARSILQDLLKTTPDYTSARFMLAAVLAAGRELDNAVHELKKLGETIDAHVLLVAMKDISRRFERNGSNEYGRYVEMAGTMISSAENNG
ncbi:MAG: glycosyltransferase [Desulfosarcinaceae bacterium]